MNRPYNNTSSANNGRMGNNGYGNAGGRHSPSFDPIQLTTPYNFVPLASKVFFPEWASKPELLTHDAPLRDGYCGTLRIRITAHTPLLVAGDQAPTNNERHPFKVGNRFALPGSTLRGMVRNVLQIASFGKFGPGVNDRAMSMRDLTDAGKVYRDTVNLNTVRAGWLTINRKGSHPFEISPTEFQRFDAKEADDWAGDVAKTGEDPYCMATDETDPRTGKTEEWIVVRTGKIPKKRMEFLFRSRSTANNLPVQNDIFSSFVTAHATNPSWIDQGGNPGPLQKRLLNEKPIPIFYITHHDGSVRAFGLAYMFRIPYRHSLHQAIGHTSSAHLDGSKLDFCEALFGIIHDGKADHPSSLRSRIGFTTAFAKRAQTHQGPGMNVVLNEPKPSFYPAYMRNGKTLMDERPQLAGWKRYPVRGHENIQNTNANNNQNIGSLLFPLKDGAEFESDITLHNIRPEELGGLLWALSWGGNPKLRHSLGMGKPFGLGNVQVEVIGIDLQHNSDSVKNCSISASPTQKDVDVLMQAFINTMSQAVLNWDTSPQLQEFTTMANPELGNIATDKLHYMPLKDFRLVKGSKGSSPQTLKPFTQLAIPHK